MNKKQLFLEFMRSKRDATSDSQAKEFIELHITKVMKMSINQFEAHEKKLKQIVKTYGNNSLTMTTKIRDLIR
jgi:hypothetical protein